MMGEETSAGLWNQRYEVASVTTTKDNVVSSMVVMWIP